MHSRTQWMIGDDGLARLASAHVLVVGLGGVGGTCAEALARSGVGRLTLVDGDVFSPSNLNRQLLATAESIGLPKTRVAAQRLQAVAPGVSVVPQQLLLTPETAELLNLDGVDFVVDAIDTVSAKLLLIEKALLYAVPVISCMGTGNKLDPTQVEVTDLAKTAVCPLARVMRRELGRRGIRHLPVVYSREQPLDVDAPTEYGRHLCGSMMFVPSTAGLACASYVVRRLLAQ